MGCSYSEEKLDEFDGVSNPMGTACSSCYSCECEHWDNCPDDCDEEDRNNHDCRKWQYFLDPYEAVP